MSVDTRNFTKQRIPSVPFEKIVSTALPGWEISLVFAGTTRARSLNKKLRNKDYVPNVLSYESGKKSGEIIICPDVAKKQMKEYGMKYAEFVAFLFIHGILHLKGQRHGTTMERHERALLARLVPVPTNETTHRNRNRHRHAPDEDRRR